MLKKILIIGTVLGKLTLVGLNPQPAVAEDADCPYCPFSPCFPGDCDC